MAKMRPCPVCKGKHRTKKAYKACYDRHKGAKPWAKGEIGR